MIKSIKKPFRVISHVARSAPDTGEEKVSSNDKNQ